jgi:hypothetical protein
MRIFTVYSKAFIAREKIESRLRWFHDSSGTSISDLIIE